jgi:hypothetical protein
VSTLADTSLADCFNAIVTAVETVTAGGATLHLASNPFDAADDVATTLDGAFSLVASGAYGQQLARVDTDGSVWLMTFNLTHVVALGACSPSELASKLLARTQAIIKAVQAATVIPWGHQRSSFQTPAKRGDGVYVQTIVFTFTQTWGIS